MEWTIAPPLPNGGLVPLVPRLEGLGIQIIYAAQNVVRPRSLVLKWGEARYRLDSTGVLVVTAPGKKSHFEAAKQLAQYVGWSIQIRDGVSDHAKTRSDNADRCFQRLHNRRWWDPPHNRHTLRQVECRFSPQHAKPLRQCTPQTLQTLISAAIALSLPRIGFHALRALLPHSREYVPLPGSNATFLVLATLFLKEGV